MITFFGDALDLIDRHSLNPELQSAIQEWKSKGTVTISTSGSTGEPKEITLPNELLQWSVAQTKQHVSLAEKEFVLCALPINKIGGRMMLVRSIVNHWKIQIQTPSSNPLLEISKNHKFSFTSLVPYQLATILNHPQSSEKLRRFSKILIGGASFSSGLERQVQAFLKSSDVEMFHTYGMTETASHIALRDLRTMPKNKFKLFSGVDASQNSSGCLRFAISSIHLDVETNDIGEIHGSTITFLSRSDEVVNSGGIKLHLAQVREKIDSILQTKTLPCSYFLWKKPDAKFGEKLILIGLKNSNEKNIETAIDSNLEGVLKPKEFYWIDAFNRTESGKIDRQKTTDALIEIGG